MITMIINGVRVAARTAPCYKGKIPHVPKRQMTTNRHHFVTSRPTLKKVSWKEYWYTIDSKNHTLIFLSSTTAGFIGVIIGNSRYNLILEGIYKESEEELLINERLLEAVKLNIAIPEMISIGETPLDSKQHEQTRMDIKIQLEKNMIIQDRIKSILEDRIWIIFTQITGPLGIGARELVQEILEIQQEQYYKLRLGLHMQTTHLLYHQKRLVEALYESEKMIHLISLPPTKKNLIKKPLPPSLK